MLHLLEENDTRIIDVYLLHLRKYIGASIKIEEQIKGRRAIWFEEVKSYLRVRLEFKQRTESLEEQRIVEIQDNEIIVHKTYIPWQIYNLEAYRKNKETLFNWKQKLI